MKRFISGGIAAVLVVSMFWAAGCKKKQPEMAPPQGQPQMGMPQKIETVLVVPDDVKKKWKVVKLSLIDKTTNKSQLISVEIGKEVAIPGTDMKVAVESFLPAFKMDGGTITSTSADQTANPAVKIKVTEKGQEVFKGWLFELYPTVHPFNHPKYNLTLAGYEKK